MTSLPANDNTVYKTKHPIAGHPRYQCLQTHREMACPPPSKKVRRPNFTEAEMLTLIEEVKKRGHVILSKLDNTVTAHSKEFAWEEVTSCVNAVSTTKRKPDEVKTKFKDLRFLVKKKAGQQGKTSNRLEWNVSTL